MDFDRLLNQISTPLWLIHIAEERITWANHVARSLSAVLDLGRFRNGHYSAIGHRELTRYLPDLLEQEIVREVWTLTTEPEPLLITCEFSLFVQDGEQFLIAEAIRVNSDLHPIAPNLSSLFDASNSCDQSECATGRISLYEQIFRANTLPMLLIDLDQDASIVDCNEPASHFYGYTRAQLCQLHAWEINTLGRDVLPLIDEVSSWRESTHPLAFKHRLADGSVRDVHVFTALIHYQQRRFLISVVQDRSVHREVEQFNRLLLESSHTGIFGINLVGEVTFSNPAATKTFGLVHEEFAIGRSLRDYLNEPERLLEAKCVTLCQLVDIFLRDWTPLDNQECEIYLPNGKRIWGLVSIAGVYSGECQSGAVITFSDISARKALEERLLYDAQRDPLTNLWNRRQLHQFQQFTHARSNRYNHGYSLALIDVDYFKRINDTYGHDMGDQVLISLAKVMAQRIRETDYLCRWGGEEFVLLMPNTGAHEATILLDALRHSIDCLQISGLTVLTVSVGLTEYQRGDGEEDLIKRADKALYQAKRLGRNRVEVVLKPS